MTVLNLDALTSGRISSEPFRFVAGSNFLAADAVEAVSRDFPMLKNAGFLTLDEVPAVGAFETLVSELRGEPLARVASQVLGLDLVGRPTLVTVMRWCPKRAGRIHTDGKSKIATLLVYLNPSWNGGSAGAVRALRSETDVNDYAEEVEPIMGNVFAFARADNSWHGHLPFEGERRVVQVTWLESEDAVARKERNNRVAQALKSLGFGKQKQQM
jgi:hypothetical protein